MKEDKFCKRKIYPVNDEKAQRTVFYTPNLLDAFNWICERNGVRKYRRARLWTLYKLLELVDFVGLDNESLSIIRINMFYEYKDLSNSVIESDLRLLCNIGLVVESTTDLPPDPSGLIEKSKERTKWEDEFLKNKP